MVAATMNVHTPALVRRRSMLGACLVAGFAPARLQAAAATAGDASPMASDASDAISPGPATPWRALMAPDWSSASYFRSLPALEIRDLDDDDPRARVLLKQLLAEGRTAPPATALHGQRVRLIGVCKPVGALVRGRVRRVLLMPYLGGCIHRPPAPANQVVLLESAQGFAQDILPYRLWVEGRLEIKPTTTSEGYAAWRIRAARVRRFDEDADRPWLMPYLLM
jgi:hypothetical protein